jgi:hypothetical protein
MASIASHQRTITPESESPELNARVAQQVADILEAGLADRRKAAPQRRSRTIQWGYSVPCAGVRYYTF